MFSRHPGGTRALGARLRHLLSVLRSRLLWAGSSCPGLEGDICKPRASLLASEMVFPNAVAVLALVVMDEKNTFLGWPYSSESFIETQVTCSNVAGL